MFGFVKNQAESFMNSCIPVRFFLYLGVQLVHIVGHRHKQNLGRYLLASTQ